MSHRIEVQITSRRPDGAWTWRVAGAREPKGEVKADLLSPDVKVGDVLRVEAEISVDGMEITEVLTPRGRSQGRPHVIEHLGSGNFKEGVVAPKGLEDGGDTRRRGSAARRPGAAGRPRRRGQDDAAAKKMGSARRDGNDGAHRQRRRDDGGRGSEGRKDSLAATVRPERRGDAAPTHHRGDSGGRHDRRPQRPRLRAGNRHVSAWLESLPEEQRDLGKQIVEKKARVLRESLLAEIAALGEAAPAEKGGKTQAPGGKTQAPKTQASDPQGKEVLEERLVLLDLLTGPMLAAEWRDRAEAADSMGNALDLRDLRSVVAGDHRAADEEAQALASRLRKKLTERVERSHGVWLAEMGSAIKSGRVASALRISCRGPKAGTPLPARLGEKLAEAASDALNAEEPENRWKLLLEAAATSPIRLVLRPRSLPANPSSDLLGDVKRWGERLPQVAAAFAEAGLPNSGESRTPGESADTPPPGPAAP